MKKQELKQIIREEIQKVLKENNNIEDDGIGDWLKKSMEFYKNQKNTPNESGTKIDKQGNIIYSLYDENSDWDFSDSDTFMITWTLDKDVGNSPWDGETGASDNPGKGNHQDGQDPEPNQPPGDSKNDGGQNNDPKDPPGNGGDNGNGGGKPDEQQNNGWGNGDDDAPGNSLNHNNAENDQSPSEHYDDFVGRFLEENPVDLNDINTHEIPNEHPLDNFDTHIPDVVLDNLPEVHFDHFDHPMDHFDHGPHSM